MVHYFSSVSFVLAFIVCYFQVNALLEDTTIAFDVGYKFITQLEKRTGYANAKDLLDDLKNLTDIYCNYSRKWRNSVEYIQIYNNKFIDLEQLIATDNHISFYGFCTDDAFILNDSALAKKSVESIIGDFEDSISMMEPIHENDYNLKGDMIWRDALNKMHKLITTPDEEDDQSFHDLLLINEKEGAKCIPRASQQQLLVQHLYKIAVIDAMAYITIQFHYAAYEMLSKGHNVIPEKYLEKFKIESALWKEKNLIKKMKTLENEFLERNVITTNAFKAHMNVSRNVWNCDLDNEDTIRDRYYGREDLKPIAAIQAFQKYVINEVDLNSDGSCTQDCPYYKQSKVHGCYDKTGICALQVQCAGNLFDCQKINGSSANICLNDQHSRERYQYMEISNKYYGYETYQCTNKVKAKHWPRGFYKCDYCMCTCESKDSDYDRYFNLRPVISDTNLNYVVTGVRFQMHNHIMHIQIQQGKLVENGFINVTVDEPVINTLSLMKWKPIDNYTINDESVIAGKDYFAISYNDRTMCLDELDSPNSSHVMTGLRFKPESENSQLYLKLEIRLTPFDYKTGRLSDKDSYWHSNNAKLQDRKEAKLEKTETTNLKSDQYFRFTASPLEDNAGQDTIPYINTVKVESFIPVPLSGAGLFLAKNYNLALKTLTYNFQGHI